MSARALEGLRVLDLSRILAGPTAAQLMGDFGAEVIKVERPGSGEDGRRLGGTPLRAPDGSATDFAPMFVSANRNKKSITIDITNVMGQDLVRRLASWADVLIENYKVGDLKRYGLDYASLAAANPRLVYCSITGFGQTGPYAPRAGFDSVFQAISGLMSTTGHADDAPGGGPLRVGVPVTEYIGGLTAFGAIMVALRHRDQVSGRGQHIDLALLDAAIAGTTVAMTDHFATGVRFVRSGNGQATSVPSQVFACADGRILISAPTDEMFARLCQVLDSPALAIDPRFADAAARVQHRTALIGFLSGIVAARTRADLLQRLAARHVPAAPVNEIDEVFADPQVRHRHNDINVPHPLFGTLRMGTNPMRLSDTPAREHAPPPMLGEHTEKILREVLDLDDAAVLRLRQARAI